MNSFRQFMFVCVAPLVVAGSFQVTGAIAQDASESSDLAQITSEGHVDSDGVKIHYVTAGSGPLVVMIHGFPAKHFQVVAIDQRGYNKSDQPTGVASYAMPKLVGDVIAGIDHFQAERAVIVGHDWGGAVAWNLAMRHPDRIDRLVILNLPHPRGLMRELTNNPEQQKNSQYARDFQQADAADKANPQMLAGWVKEPDAREKYIEAFGRSSMEGMLNYYKANFPRPPARPAADASPTPAMPQVKCRVLMFHGLDDKALLASCLNDNWDWIDNELTLITIPGAGHFVHRDAAGTVTKRMVDWLTD